jgi:uncharacterized protein YkwD
MTLPAFPISIRAAIGSLLMCLALAACTTGGGLSPGLTARMDEPGAVLDRTEALALINSYRSSQGEARLAADASLDATAQALASRYAATNERPSRPDDIEGLRISAGYATFAETFSGWRNSPEDSDYLTASGIGRAGLGVVYSAESTYGVYWVLVLAQ